MPHMGSLLADQQNKSSGSYQQGKQNTDDERNNRMPTGLDLFRPSAFLRSSDATRREVCPSTDTWQRRTNVWRKATNPARAAKRLRSVRVVFRYRRREMTKEEQVVGLIFQVTMWAYIAAAAAYVVIG